MVVTTTRSPLLAQTQPKNPSTVNNGNNNTAAMRSRLIFPRQHYQLTPRNGGNTVANRASTRRSLTPRPDDERRHSLMIPHSIAAVYSLRPTVYNSL
ncbi:hypothetical protein ACLKA7_017080 [Drosophila subpalustris]